MKSLRLLDRRAGYSLSAIGLLLGIVAPAAIPAFASASGVLETKSITMSSSSASATGVSYELQFTTETAITDTGGVVIQFCNSATGPLIGASCTAPTALDTSSTGAAPTAVKINGSTAPDPGTLAHSGSGSIATWTAGTGDSLSIGDSLQLTIGGMVNPSTTGTFYARVYTYANATDLATFSSATVLGTTADTGSVALSTSANVGISAYVLETMTFCVSHAAPTSNCAGTDTPNLTLGEIVSGSLKALSASAVSTGQDYAQLSTNASHGAVVNLHSNNAGCGGLVRPFVAANCDIKAQATGANTISNGDALFGVKFGSAATASGVSNASGTLQPSGTYSTSKYFMDYDTDDSDTTGVTSTYGSPFFDTNNLPVNGKNIPFTFGASVDNNAPAGSYGATLNLVATGTF